jgi:aminomethyltransferase
METALHQNHLDLGAKFTTFSGYELPLHYGSILQEHAAVREKCGIFDVSHMGRIEITGKDTIPFLNSLSTNSLNQPVYGKGLYTIFCNNEGFPVDDVILFPESAEKAFLVANAGNKNQVLEHLKSHKGSFSIEIEPCFEGQGILSLQGPQSSQRIASWAPKLNRLEFQRLPNQLIVSRTGYTGEDGYELMGDLRQLKPLFIKFTEEGVQPCGLGARDLLRLEMGYALYGHELSHSISPIESVSAWCVKLKDHDFLGKEAIHTLKISGKARYAIGAIGQTRAIAREGSQVFKNDEEIGYVTSGSYSPSCSAPICCLLLNKRVAEGENLAIKIREDFHPFQAVLLPFIHKERKQ